MLSPKLKPLFIKKFKLIYPFKFKVADNHYVAFFHSSLLQLGYYASVLKHLLEKCKAVFG